MKWYDFLGLVAVVTGLVWVTARPNEYTFQGCVVLISAGFILFDFGWMPKVVKSYFGFFAIISGAKLVGIIKIPSQYVFIGFCAGISVVLYSLLKHIFNCRQVKYDKFSDDDLS